MLLRQRLGLTEPPRRLSEGCYAMSDKRVISARSILQSIHEGLSCKQLMEKHGLSRAGLRNALKQIQDERDRRASQIIQDFLSGMQVQDIAARNGFPVERFLSILRRGVHHQGWSPPDLIVETETAAFQVSNGEKRRYPRIRCPVLKVHVRDSSSPGMEGTVHDISEKGIGVRGFPAKIDDEKTFLISESDFDLPDPIVLTCTCRWTGKVQHPDFGDSAGFEITAISESDDRHLRSWIDAEARMTFSGQFVGT